MIYSKKPICSEAKYRGSVTLCSKITLRFIRADIMMLNILSKWKYHVLENTKAQGLQELKNA